MITDCFGAQQSDLSGAEPAAPIELTSKPVYSDWKRNKNK